eukprot:SAG25_NODE_873_length_4990_cov_1.501533_7_plen_156_part_00
MRALARACSVPGAARLTERLTARRSKWHLGCVTRAYTPTYRGYSSFLGYYHAMTEDYWAHTHSTGANCPGPGLGGLWSDMSNSSGTALGMSPDNGTYESTLFGDHAVATIAAHASLGGASSTSTGAAASTPPPPLFMYRLPNRASGASVSRLDSA